MSGAVVFRAARGAAQCGNDFSPAIAEPGMSPDGSGLVGMADRLAVIDGRLRVESRVGSGTVVSADIPLSVP